MNIKARIECAEITLARLDGWKEGFMAGAKTQDEPHVLVEAACAIQDYIALLQTLPLTDSTEETRG